MDFLRMLMQMVQQGGWGGQGFGQGFGQADPGPVEYLPYKIPGNQQSPFGAGGGYSGWPTSPGGNAQGGPGMGGGLGYGALPGMGPPGGDVNPVGGGRNWSGPITAQDPNFGSAPWGTGRMYAGGNPGFNEMNPGGSWMTTALGGTGRINPLQPSGNNYSGSAGSYQPMMSSGFELR